MSQVVEESGEPRLRCSLRYGSHHVRLHAEDDIDGVDISPEMISKAHENAGALGLKPNLYVQSMQNLDIPACYQTIIVPSSFISYI